MFPGAGRAGVERAPRLRAAVIVCLLLAGTGAGAALSRGEVDVLSSANEAAGAGRHDEAAALLEELLGRSDLSREARATGGMTLAYVLAQRGDQAGALDRYEALLAGRDLTVGQRTTVLYTAAQLAFLLDRHEDALRHYRGYRNFEERPSAARRVFLAQILYQLDRHEEMIPPLQEVAAEARARGAPLRTDWLRLLNFACYETGAAACLEETQDELFLRDPSAAAAERAVASFLQLGDGPRTARALRRVVDNYPDGGFASDLHVAAAAGDTAAVAARIAAGDELDAALRLGRTPLHLAAWFGHLEAAETLLAAGARVDAVNGNDETAMSFAAFAGRPELVRLLWEAGADAESLGRYTPFQLMARAGATALALELLDAYPEQLATHGDDALYLAVLEGHGETAAALLERGASVHYRRDEARSMLEVVAGRGDGPLLARLLAAGAGAGEHRVDLDVALVGAGVEDSGADVLALLDAGARPGHRDEAGRTALWVAAGWGSEVAVSALVEAGAELELADDSGRTPLQMAVRGGHGAAARVLVAAGADHGRPYPDGRAVLTNAVASGDVDLVRALLAAGAHPDAGAAFAGQGSPLAYAVVTGDVEVLDALLEAGALLLPATGEPHHHLLNAVLSGDAAMVARLVDAGLPVDGPLAAFDDWDSRRVSRFLRQRGFECVARDDATETWLLAAPVWQPDGEDVRFVLPRQRTELSLAELVDLVETSGYGMQQWMEDVRGR